MIEKISGRTKVPVPMRLLLFAIASLGAILWIPHGHAATSSTTVQTSYARASTYRPNTSAADSDARTADDETGRDVSNKSSQSGKGSTRRSGGTRDDMTRPRWHSTLPGMLR